MTQREEAKGGDSRVEPASDPANEPDDEQPEVPFARNNQEVFLDQNQWFFGTEDLIIYKGKFQELTQEDANCIHSLRRNLNPGNSARLK